MEIYKESNRTNDTELKIFLKGNNRKEIIQEFWKYFNHGAVFIYWKSVRCQTSFGDEIADDKDFHWINEYSGYFHTNPVKMVQSLKSIYLIRLLEKHDPEGKLEEDTELFKKLHDEALIWGQEEYKKIPVFEKWVDGI